MNEQNQQNQPNGPLSLWRRLLNERLGINELRTLVFDLGVDYDNLSGEGETKSRKIESLLQLLERQGRLGALKEEVFRDPNLTHLKNAYLEDSLQLRQRRLADFDPEQAPYRGMDVFEERHAPIFFGREALSSELVQRVQFTVSQPGQTNFLAIIGASGSGKSSLVRAGMLPQLRKLGWPITIITPTTNPLEEVTVRLFKTLEIKSVADVDILVADFLKTEKALHLWLKREYQSETPILLVIDQFEELFTLCKDETLRSAFVDNLLYALNPAQRSPLIVILTLRADFYAQVAWSEGLRTQLEQQQKFIGRMSQVDLKRAIEGPAHLSQAFDFQEGLVDLILSDVADTEGGLPLLSHALLETWKRRDPREDRPDRLTLTGYHSAGGVQGAIARTADAHFQKLSQPNQAIAKNIFLRLTELGEGSEDTRRRATLSELIPAKSDPDSVMDVLAELASARLISTGKNAVDVTHEALIRKWDRLRSWLNADRSGLRILEELTHAANFWDGQERQEVDLYSGTRLANALDWRTKSQPQLSQLEAEFLNQSAAFSERIEREEEERRLREAEQLQKLAEEQSKLAAEQQKLAEEAGRRAEAEEDARLRAEEAQQEAEKRSIAEEAARQQAEVDAKRVRIRNRIAVGFATLGITLAALSFFLFQDSQNSLTIANDKGTEAADNLETATISQGEAENAKETAVAESTRALRAEATAKAERDISATANAVADQERKTAETNLARSSAQGLMSQGRIVYEDNPILGLALTLEGLQLAAALDELETLAQIGDVRQSIFQWGRVSNLSGEVDRWGFNESGSLVLIDYFGSDVVDELRDGETGELIAPLSGEVDRWGFNENGSWVLIGYVESDGELRDGETGELIAPLSGVVTNWGFNESGSRVLIAYFGSNGELRNGETGELIAPLSGEVTNWGFNESGSRVLIAYVGSNGELRNGETGELIAPLSGEVTNWGFNESGSRVLIAYVRSNGELRDGETGELIAPLSGGVVDRWGFNESGSRVLIAYVGSNGELRDGETGELIAPLSGVVDWWVFNESGSLVLIAYVGSDGELRDGETGELIAPLSGVVDRLDFNESGSRVLIGYVESDGELRDGETGELIAPLSGVVTNWGFNESGSRVLIAYVGSNGELRNGETGELITPLSGEVTNWGFNESGSRVLIAYVGSNGELRDGETGELIAPLSGGVVDRWGFNESGSRVLIAYVGSNGELRDGETGELIAPLSGVVDRWGFNESGSRVLIGYVGSDGELRDGETGELIAPLSGVVTNWGFNESGSLVLIAYVGSNGELRDGETGELIAPLSGVVDQWGFNENGSRVLIAYSNGTSEIFNDNGKLVSLGENITFIGLDAWQNAIVVSYGTGQSYVVDVRWIQSMNGNVDSLPIEQLIRLACDYPLDGGEKLNDPALLSEMRTRLEAVGVSAPQACERE